MGRVMNKAVLIRYTELVRDEYLFGGTVPEIAKQSRYAT